MKKTGFLALCLALALCVGALAEPIALNMQEEDALVTPEGVVLVAPEQYGEIYAIGGGYYALGEYVTGEDGFLRTRFALADASGRALTPVSYDSLICRDGILYFEMGGRFGAMDTALNTLVPCEYTRLIGDGSGGFLGLLALRTDPWDTTADAVYSLDGSGAERATDVAVVDLGGEFSQGLIPALSSQTQAYGYLNVGGEWAIAPEFLYADAFSGNAARAATAQGMGLIGTDGAWRVEPRYDAIDYEDGALIVATKYGEGVYLFDRNTFALVRHFAGEDVYGALNGEWAVIYQPDGVMLVDVRGQAVLTCGRGASIAVGQRRAVVADGDFGGQSVWLYDFAGNRIAGSFQALTSAGVHEGRELFVVDAFEVKEINDGGIDSYLSWNLEDMRSGLVDENGVQVLPCEYEVLYAVGENRFFARKDGVEGMIDAAGNWLVRFGSDS